MTSLAISPTRRRSCLKAAASLRPTLSLPSANTTRVSAKAKNSATNTNAHRIILSEVMGTSDGEAAYRKASDEAAVPGEYDALVTAEHSCNLLTWSRLP